MSGSGVSSDQLAGRRASRAHVRAALLAAAEEVFGKRGFAGASIGEITRKAGIAQGSFYLHFPSKEEIFRELIDKRGAELRETLRRSVRGMSERAEIERAGLEAFFDWISRHPWFYRATRQAEFIDPALREAWYREFAAEYAAALARAMDDGVIPRADPEVVAWAIMGAADFTAMRWLVWEQQDRIPPDRLDAFLSVAHRALGFTGER